MGTRRRRVTLGLNIASLALGFVGAGCAAYPVLRPFHGQETVPLTVDLVTLPKTPEFERWQRTGDTLGRLGLFLVALGTIAAGTAQILDSAARRSKVTP